MTHRLSQERILNKKYGTTPNTSNNAACTAPALNASRPVEANPKRPPVEHEHLASNLRSGTSRCSIK
jgi:hypothetical protein